MFLFGRLSFFGVVVPLVVCFDIAFPFFGSFGRKKKKKILLIVKEERGKIKQKSYPSLLVVFLLFCFCFRYYLFSKRQLELRKEKRKKKKRIFTPQGQFLLFPYCVITTIILINAFLRSGLSSRDKDVKKSSS